MASTTASMSTHNPRNCLIVNSFRNSPTKPSSVPTTFRQSEPSNKLDLSLSLVKTAAVAGVVISNLATSPLAMAAKQIAESPQEDNRGLALLIPVVPAVGWVLYNILGPALGQLNRMRSEKGIIVGLGLGGLAAAENALYVSTASAASEVVESEGASGGSNLLPLIVAAAVAFEVILFSTMQSKYEEKKSD